MITKQRLISDFQDIGINPNGTLLVHSSMKAIGDVEGGADTVLDALSEFMSEGLLLLPTHSWDKHNLANGIYDPKTEPSCVGILGEMFRQREGVLRSLHPTHSMAALGKNAEQFIAGEETLTSPCPRHGAWGKLYDVDAQILFLGCPLTRNTYIHGVEEWSAIPNRIDSESEAITIIKGDEAIETILRRHKSPFGSIHENYDKLERPFVRQGIGHWGTIGEARSFLASAKGMADIVQAFLKRNQDVFLYDDPIPESWYE
ncbi:AAC(3) family N-acetyltransferase [Vibrio mediterranei]|uniref:AAC(3) family N-acetyltransferase n=1 Tax=Vibrio mediterranei TaxID=689 RepID=UPI00181E7CAE|nr:AAC(3) family N-acetyltransferase [Vibrio mediterranei]NUW74573.1 AAC(3) family N-acetyltransferase [Vibrio mediterranei]